MVSPAESEIVRREGFIPVDHPKYSTFLGPDTLKNIESKVSLHPINVEFESSKVHEIDKAPIRTVKSSHKKEGLLAEARKMADQGQFDEALKLCFDYIEASGPDAEAYFLVGVIQQAMGDDDEAEKYFFKAVYLNPQHSHGLVCLSLLAEKRGETQKAELYRHRARKITALKDEKEANGS